jgi:hypothetical protein
MFHVQLYPHLVRSNFKEQDAYCRGLEVFPKDFDVNNVCKNLQLGCGIITM